MAHQINGRCSSNHPFFFMLPLYMLKAWSCVCDLFHCCEYGFVFTLHDFIGWFPFFLFFRLWIVSWTFLSWKAKKNKKNEEITLADGNYSQIREAVVWRRRSSESFETTFWAPRIQGKAARGHRSSFVRFRCPLLKYWLRYWHLDWYIITWACKNDISSCSSYCWKLVKSE